MKKTSPRASIHAKLIAPCGMNCGICIGFLREKNRCHGCLSKGASKANHCSTCVIKQCAIRKKEKAAYCLQCSKYPCRRLVKLDARYRENYHMSMIENLESIRDHGIRKFVASEKKRWTCTKCDGTVCVHRGFCIDCGYSV